ncbi:MAG TPA: antitoxin Xre/MbcA/ParS toxin-binding domain-containing protein [Stellaceae bacterium]|nr:antitoxin Xre/MbcA/ParS toxin-binding domain-containing protein [Stellaceae bacterium]
MTKEADLGRWAALGNEAFSRADFAHPTDQVAFLLTHEIRKGLPVQAIATLVDQGGFTVAELDQVIISRKTLAHRRQIGTLTPDQSDRVVRAISILALAQETFGSAAKANEWLRRKTSTLAGQSPLEMLDTEIGALQVQTLLGRIAHGIAA